MRRTVRADAVRTWFLLMRRALAAAVFAVSVVSVVSVVYASPIFGPGPAKGEAEGVSILPIWLS